MVGRLKAFAVLALACICLLCLPYEAFAANDADHYLHAGTVQTDSVQVSTLGAVRAPSAPVISGVDTKALGTITVEIKPQKDASGFQYVISTSRKFKSKLQVKSTSAQKIQFRNLKTNKKYYIKVRAYRTVNGKTVFGKWSKRKTVKTRKPLLGIVGSLKDSEARLMKRNGCQVAIVRSADVNPDSFDGIIIPGGGDVDPALYGQERDKHVYGVKRQLDELEISVIRRFAEAKKPVLGVCRGQQIINVAFGGTLCQHIPGWHKRYRNVSIKAGSWLYATFGSAESVYHYHHQCVLELGEGLVATQWDAKDGRIEAIQHESLPVYGLQWHPEYMGKRGNKVARAFIQVCINYSKPY